MRSSIAIRRNQRGFTLAEILVTTAIFAIIMIAALTVYDRSNKVFKSGTEAADLQQSTRIAFDKLVSDLRMAGFDYSRGGIPTGNGQFQQPDEQIEYAGVSAVVFRANFDYNSQAQNGNGLALGYSAQNSGGGPIFPYVTTDNTEVVAYALRSSAPGAPNGDSISFYVDWSVPRRAYPNVSGLTAGGLPETSKTLNGIDLSNSLPPYTLYRVTLADILNASPGTFPLSATPIAENIRSLQFKYYTDGQGTLPLTNADGTPILTGHNGNTGNTPFTAAPSTCTATVLTDCTGAIGGDGLYDPANVGTTPNFTDRQQRSLIQSIRVDLVGMNANPETNYQNPTETNSSYVNYRQYSLSSLVVPRNLGKTGFPEPSYNPPGPPTITGACVGHCGAPFLTWSAPAAGGPVTAYQIQWDTDPNGAFASPPIPVNDPSVTSTVVPDNGTLDPSQIIYYRIVAINDNGQSQPSQNYPVTPQNTTKPSAPAGPATGTFGSTGQSDKITLAWQAPTTNASGSLTCSGTVPPGSTTATNIPAGELMYFQVYRGITSSFQPPGAGVKLLDITTDPLHPQGSEPQGVTPGAAVTWIDQAPAPTQSLAPPAPCVQYYYRVRSIDRCSTAANRNVSGNVNDSISDWYPALANPAAGGISTSTMTPADPSGAAIDPTHTVCPPATGNTCSIGLTWSAVTSVDIYTIKRDHRTQGTLAWSNDTTFGTLGTTDVNGYSQNPPAYVDMNAPYSDPILGPWDYRYSVAAKICSTPSAGYSNYAIWPGCGFTSNITAPGASIGSGISTDPWVLNYSDSIVVAAVTGTISSVSFQIKQGTTNVGSAYVVNSSPFTRPWSDLTDSVVYNVWITMTDTTGCSETAVRYVTQAPAPGCQFKDVAATGRPGGPPTPVRCLQTGQNSCSPATATFDFAFSPAAASNYSATNDQPALVLTPTPASPEPMKFTTVAGFTGSFTLTWADINGLHPELNLASVDWYRMSSTNSLLTGPISVSVGKAFTRTTLSTAITATDTSITVGSTASFPGTGTFYIDSEAITYTGMTGTTFTGLSRGQKGTSAATHLISSDVELIATTTVSAPVAFPDINAGESLRFVLHFTFDSSHKNTQLTTSGSILQTLCIQYKVGSDTSRTQNCNLLGKSGTTANPGSCD